MITRAAVALLAAATISFSVMGWQNVATAGTPCIDDGCKGPRSSSNYGGSNSNSDSSSCPYQMVCVGGRLMFSTPSAYGSLPRGCRLPSNTRC